MFCGETSRCKAERLAVLVACLVRRVQAREHIDADLEHDVERNAPLGLAVFLRRVLFVREPEQRAEALARDVGHDDEELAVFDRHVDR
jgi:hypothetical protein